MAPIYSRKWVSLVLFFFLFFFFPPRTAIARESVFVSRYFCVLLCILLLFIVWLLYDTKLFLFLEKMKEFLRDQFTTIVTTFGVFHVASKSCNCSAEIRQVLFISQLSKLLTLAQTFEWLRSKIFEESMPFANYHIFLL